MYFVISCYLIVFFSHTNHWFWETLEIIVFFNALKDMFVALCWQKMKDDQYLYFIFLFFSTPGGALGWKVGSLIHLSRRGFNQIEGLPLKFLAFSNSFPFVVPQGKVIQSQGIWAKSLSWRRVINLHLQPPRSFDVEILEQTQAYKSKMGKHKNKKSWQRWLRHIWLQWTMQL